MAEEERVHDREERPALRAHAIHSTEPRSHSLSPLTSLVDLSAYDSC